MRPTYGASASSSWLIASTSPCCAPRTSSATPTSIRGREPPERFPPLLSESLFDEDEPMPHIPLPSVGGEPLPRATFPRLQSPRKLANGPAPRRRSHEDGYVALRRLEHRAGDRSARSQVLGPPRGAVPGCERHRARPGRVLPAPRGRPGERSCRRRLHSVSLSWMALQRRRPVRARALAAREQEDPVPGARAFLSAA